MNKSLLSKLESLTGADRETDLEIFALLNPERAAEMKSQNRIPLPWMYRYTESIDHALTLIPEGAYWRVEDHPEYGISAFVDDEQAFGATPALAICAAALKARREE